MFASTNPLWGQISSVSVTSLTRRGIGQLSSEGKGYAVELSLE